MRSKLVGLCVLCVGLTLGASAADAKQPRRTQVKKAAVTRPVPDLVAGQPNIRSAAALIVEEETGRTLYAKNTEQITPIASITKLMTAMVTLDAELPLDEAITITEDDVDLVKGTRSRVTVGAVLTRGDLLRLALMASENRAASALGRTYPGGRPAFIAAMNAKAQLIGMHDSRFVDSTGLRSDNVSTAEDLARLVDAADDYPVIREFSTLMSHEVELPRYRRPVEFRNTNVLVRSGSWDIGLQKTGYISEAGRCLVMQATIAGRHVIIVLLDSAGKNTRIGDANRIRKWMEGRLDLLFPRVG